MERFRKLKPWTQTITLTNFHYGDKVEIAKKKSAVPYKSINFLVHIVWNRSRLHQLIRTMVLAPLLLAGINEERQQLQVELFSDFEDDQTLPVTDAYVELQSRFAQVYACELHIEAHFTGLRYLMFNWPKVAAVIGVSTNLFFVSLIFILSWYQLQDGLPDFVKLKLKTEVKTELESEAEAEAKQAKPEAKRSKEMMQLLPGLKTEPVDSETKLIDEVEWPSWQEDS